MSAEQHVTDSLTSSAPTEGNISVQHAYTDIIMLKGNNCDATLDSMLGAYLEGTGNVDLVSIAMKVMFTKTGQTVFAGFAADGASMTVEQAAGKFSGFMNAANTLNVGNSIDVKLVPEDTLSRQIRPVSSLLPMMKFMLKASDGVFVMVHFYIKVNGMRIRMGSF